MFTYTRGIWHMPLSTSPEKYTWGQQGIQSKNTAALFKLHMHTLSAAFHSTWQLL